MRCPATATGTGQPLAAGRGQRQLARGRSDRAHLPRHPLLLLPAALHARVPCEPVRAPPALARPRTRALTPAQPRPPARAYAHACTRAQGPHAARHLGAALLLLLRRARLGCDYRGGAVDAACARRRCGPPPVRAACDGGHGDGGGERGAGDAAIVRCAEPKPAPQPTARAPAPAPTPGSLREAQKPEPDLAPSP